MSEHSYINIWPSRKWRSFKNIIDYLGICFEYIYFYILFYIY